MQNLSNQQSQNQPKKQKLTPSSIIERQLAQGAILHQDLEVGVNIKKGISLIKDLSSSGFELSQSEKNIIFQYCRSGKPIDIIIPTCPDYLPYEQITGFEDPILSGGVPKQLKKLIQTIKTFTKLLNNNEIPQKVKILIDNPRIGLQILSHLPSQEPLINQSLLSSLHSIKTKFESVGLCDIEVSTFMEELSYSQYADLEDAYNLYFKKLYNKDESFKTQVDMKIVADRGKTMNEAFTNALKFRDGESQSTFERDDVIRNFSDFLALGKILDNNYEQPLLIGFNKRTTINQRNISKMELPGIEPKEHRTIPVIIKPTI
jgi:hypothetical protein